MPDEESSKRELNVVPLNIQSEAEAISESAAAMLMIYRSLIAEGATPEEAKQIVAAMLGSQK